jgi:predicted RND superfamily exporter protein
LIASVALGLCVDDTIHFVHHFQHHYSISGKVEEAIEATTRDSGRAIVSTSVVLILSIAPCGLATLYSLVWFGLLIIAAIGFAVFADLVLTPAIFRSLYKDRI